MGSARRLYLLAGIFHLVVLEALLVPAILFWPDLAKSIAPLLTTPCPVTSIELSSTSKPPPRTIA